MTSFKNAAILPMKEGPERELMSFLFQQMKQTRGLTTSLDQHAGINGKWFKPHEPYNIPSYRLLRMIVYAALYIGEDQFRRDFDHIINYLYKEVVPLFISMQAEKEQERAQQQSTKTETAPDEPAER